MNRIIVMAIATIMAISTMSAQYQPGTVSIQPKIGIGVSNITGLGRSDLSNAVIIDKAPCAAALVGADLEYQISDKLGMCLGINYSLQGCAWENYSVNKVRYKYPRVELGYFYFPIVANIYIIEGVALKTGIQFGVLSDAAFKTSFKTTVEQSEVTYDASIDLKDEFEKLDVSIPFGLSYESSKHWVFDARYNLGVLNINKNRGDEYKNSVFMITCGYKISL